MVSTMDKAETRTVTFRAENISLVEVSVEVPIDADDEELAEIRDGLDGSAYVEYDADWEDAPWIDHSNPNR